MCRKSLKLAVAVFVGTMGLAWAEAGAAPPDYDLPRECPTFAKHHDQTWDQLEGQPDVNWFLYVEAICEQYFLAQKSAKTAAHDYVSGLDFANLGLDEVPYIDCEIGAVSRSYAAWCQAVDRKFPTLSQAHFQILWELFHKPDDFPEATPEHMAAARAVPVDRESCQLERRDDSGFSDWAKNLVVTDGRATCVRVSLLRLGFGFTIEISRTLFRDVDQDGYMDALWIVHDYHDGTGSNTETIVVTRKKPGRGPLTKVRFHHLWK